MLSLRSRVSMSVRRLGMCRRLGDSAWSPAYRRETMAPGGNPGDAGQSHSMGPDSLLRGNDWNPYQMRGVPDMTLKWTTMTLAIQLAAGLFSVCIPLIGQAAEPIDIGSRRELFIDRLLIDKMDGTQLKMHTPHLAPRVNQSQGHYATILNDGGLLRMYSRGNDPLDNGWKKYGFEFYHSHELTLYAESKDGIHWREPNLGLYKVAHYPHGNIVLAGQWGANHNFAPFIDVKPGVSAKQKYKALGGVAYAHRKAVRAKRGPGGLAAYVSADGIHWKKLQKQNVIPESWGTFDSQNCAFWSESENRYVCYFRLFHKGYRSIGRTTSQDFIHWTKPVRMKANVPGEHLYTSVTQPYFRAPHIYIATPTRFMSKRGSTTDILLMSTRGGDTYDRTFMEAFIRPGVGKTGWGNRSNYAAIGIHQTGSAEMSIFLYGNRRYTLRLDGFSSLNAGYIEGEMQTKPFTFSGKSLDINVSTSAGGRMRIEIQDTAGQPIPGFALKDCLQIVGDQITRRVAWKTGSDVSKLAGRPIRLRFVMQDADLYSLRFR